MRPEAHNAGMRRTPDAGASSSALAVAIASGVRRIPALFPGANASYDRAPRAGSRSGSTFIIVLWVAFGLVSLTLYFAHSMSSELRAADNGVCAIQSEQVVDGAERYLTYILATLQTNGVMPHPATYLSEQVSVGEGRFWIIGRETNNPTLAPNSVTFGLVDEGSKLNLNTASSNLLVWLPRMTEEMIGAIQDWRDPNGGSGIYDTFYAMSTRPYQNKCAQFESVDELRLLFGSYLDILEGEDHNRNGVLDPDEYDEDRNGVVDPGILEYVTVYSREPNTYSNGTPRVDISTVAGGNGPLPILLQNTFGGSRASQILARLGLDTSGNQRGGGPQAPQIQTFRSPLDLYQRSGMTVEEFGQIAKAITVVPTTNAWITGRININTASGTVLSCLPGLIDAPDVVQTIINYREQNPDQLVSVGWLVEALGQNNRSILNGLAQSDLITTESYQFSADIAALGPYGRGYRRIRFIFDTAEGTPRVVFRQDLTHLGWALGRDVRQRWVLTRNSNAST